MVSALFCGYFIESGGGIVPAVNHYLRAAIPVGDEAGGVNARGDLGSEGLGVVKLAGDVADFGDGQARQLVLLVWGKGVGEVDDDHGWTGSQAAMPMAVLRPMPA